MRFTAFRGDQSAHVDRYYCARRGRFVPDLGRGWVNESSSALIAMLLLVLSLLAFLPQT